MAFFYFDILHCMNGKRKLYRSTEDRLVAGVLAGLAEYFDQDAVFWRLGFVALLFLTGFMPAILFYFIAWILIPEKPRIEPVDSADYTTSD